MYVTHRARGGASERKKNPAIYSSFSRLMCVGNKYSVRATKGTIITTLLCWRVTIDGMFTHQNLFLELKTRNH